MALETGKFHKVVLRPIAAGDPAWTALAQRPNVPPAAIAAMLAGSEVEVYCVDAPSGTLVSVEAGWLVGFVDEVLLAVSPAYPVALVTAQDGTPLVAGLAPGGELRTFDPVSSSLRRYSAQETAALRILLGPAPPEPIP